MTERSIHDDVLGTLTWNSQLDWWEGSAELSPDHSVRLSIGVEEDDASADPDVQPAHRLLARLREDEIEARVVAADELLTIYNEEWNDGPPLSEEEFVARLTIDDINVAYDGSAELFYKDNGLFAGHTITVFVNADGRFEDADVAG